MPKEFFGREYEFLKRDQLLSFEEITRLARLFASLGVKKVRITGGEPLIRRDIEDLIASLALIPELDLTMTTNGALLAERGLGGRPDSGLAVPDLGHRCVRLDRCMSDVAVVVGDIERLGTVPAAGLEVTAFLGRVRWGGRERRFRR